MNQPEVLEYTPLVVFDDGFPSYRFNIVLL